MFSEPARLPTTMPDSRGKYTLDELLKAKRNERPEPEFWLQFNRELKIKQRQLIQSQLAKETRVKSPLASRVYKFGAFTATFGVAAFAVYLGFQPSTQDSSPTQTVSPSVALQEEKPIFTVAKTEAPTQSEVSQPVGLKEFSTLAQSSSPRVSVRTAPVQVAKSTPTPAQLTALETLAELESTIRGNRANGPVPVADQHFESYAGMFDQDFAEIVVSDEELASNTWDIENAYLLGKYADPITGTLSSGQNTTSISEIQSVSFSQLDDAISSQSRRSSRSLDALTVKF